MSRFVVIAGLSGAGRSQAANALEDLGWFVMDNVPPTLIPKVGELGASSTSAFDRIGLVVRAGPWQEEIRPALDALRATGAPLQVVFLEAATDTLVRRYEDTRRRHPFAEHGRTVADAIEAERALLQPLRAAADAVIDTSDLNVHQFRDRIHGLFADESSSPGMRINVVSFGYKHGLPLDVDLVFDMRFLPNPHWVEELRPLTGLDGPVSAYVLGQPESGAFLERLDALLELLLPAYAEEGKSYLSIAFGCTGGRHRSVAVAEEVALRLIEAGYDPAVIHRDVQR